MIKLRNIRFGNVMWVDEKRVDEYLAKGNVLVETPTPAPAPKKSPAKRKGRVKK